MRVLVANRPRLMRAMLMATIADQPDIEIVGEVVKEEDLNEAVEQMQPDVLILALEEPERRLGQCGFLLGRYPRMVLNDEQKKKYDPLAVRKAGPAPGQKSVEDWLKDTKPQ